MAAIADGGEPIDELKGFSGKLGRDAFVAILAGQYGRLLNDLCRRDYRRYFQSIEENLSGRIRGRIHVSGHVRNTLCGRQHRVPCRWEEFTSDNWDNRILLAALRRLQQSAALIAPEARRYVSNMFLVACRASSDSRRVRTRCHKFVPGFSRRRRRTCGHRGVRIPVLSCNTLRNESAPRLTRRPLRV